MRADNVTVLEYMGSAWTTLTFMTALSTIPKAMTGSSQDMCLAP